MPKLDGTGPMGEGPRTGRGLGSCGGRMRRGRCGLRRYNYGFKGLSLEQEEKMLEERLAAIREQKEASQRDQQK